MLNFSGVNREGKNADDRKNGCVGYLQNLQCADLGGNTQTFFYEGMRVCLHVQCFAVGHPKRRKQHALEYQDKRKREAQVCEG